jgi:hypothetical protein
LIKQPPNMAGWRFIYQHCAPAGDFAQLAYGS